MFKALYSHVNNILKKIFTNMQPYPIIFTMGKKEKKLKLKQLLNHIHNDKKREKLKRTQSIQIYKNNDPLLLNLVNKYVFSDLLKLKMVFDFRNS